MNFAVSDLLFPGYEKAALPHLASDYGIEFFYEFGKDYYWDAQRQLWGKRELSIHGPAVAVNLADPRQKNYRQIFEKTFNYARKCGACFVVIHTNEGLEHAKGGRERTQMLVVRRLRHLLRLAAKFGVAPVIENVGLAPKQNLLFDRDEYLAIFEELPEAHALIDTGHAHVNGWDVAEVVAALGPRLLGCHLHDNDGSADAHQPIGTGTLDWQSYFAAAKQYAPQATMVLEYACGSFADTAALEKHIKSVRKLYKV